MTTLTTVGLFALLMWINRTAANVEIPVAPPPVIATAVVKPPEIPAPPKPDPPETDTKVVRTTPTLDAAPPEEIKFNPSLMPDFASKADGVLVNTQPGTFFPETPYDPVELDRRPDSVQRIAPDYPYEMKRAGIDGWARIEFIVEADGTVSHARIDAASDREFGEAGLQAVRNWRFTPGMKDNQPVRTWMVQPFDFNADR